MAKNITKGVNYKEWSFPIYSIKADESTGILEGVCNLFGIIDGGNDVIHNGSFAKTLSESWPKRRFLDMHKTNSVSDVIAKILELKELGRDELDDSVKVKFPEATGGLYFKIQFLLNTPEGKGAFERYKSGAIDEFSIGYEPLQFDYQTINKEGKNIEIRNLRQIRLWEISAVIWGMNQGTFVTNVKNQENNAVLDDRATITSTDDVKTKISLFLNELKGSEKDCWGDYVISELCDEFNEMLFMLPLEIKFSEIQLMMEVFKLFIVDLKDKIPNAIYTIPCDTLLTSVTEEDSQFFVYDSISKNNTEEKAGRVLSSVNFTKLSDANKLISEVLESATIIESDSTGTVDKSSIEEVDLEKKRLEILEKIRNFNIKVGK